MKQDRSPWRRLSLNRLQGVHRSDGNINALREQCQLQTEAPALTEQMIRSNWQVRANVLSS